MSSELEQVQERIDILKKYGAKGPFFLAPTQMGKRCFVPCIAGKCNCPCSVVEIYYKYYSVVSEDFKAEALKDVVDEINYVNKKFEEILK